MRRFHAGRGTEFLHTWCRTFAQFRRCSLRSLVPALERICFAANRAAGFSHVGGQAMIRQGNVSFTEKTVTLRVNDLSGFRKLA